MLAMAGGFTATASWHGYRLGREGLLGSPQRRRGAEAE